MTTPSHPQKFRPQSSSVFEFQFQIQLFTSHLAHTAFHVRPRQLKRFIDSSISLSRTMQTQAMHPRLLLSQMLCTAVNHDAVTPAALNTMAQVLLVQLNILGAPLHFQPMLEGFWTCTAVFRATIGDQAFFPHSMTDLAFPGMPALPDPSLWTSLQHHRYREWIQFSLPTVLSTWASFRTSIEDHWRPRRISNTERLVLRTVEDMHLVLQNLRDFLQSAPDTTVAQYTPNFDPPAPRTPQQWLGTF